MLREIDQTHLEEHTNKSADYYLWLHISDYLKYALKKSRCELLVVDFNNAAAHCTSGTHCGKADSNTAVGMKRAITYCKHSLCSRATVKEIIISYPRLPSRSCLCSPTATGICLLSAH